MKNIVFGLSLEVVALLIVTNSDFPMWMRILAAIAMAMYLSVYIYDFFKGDNDEETSNRSS